jgi:hypothetical protein
MSAQLREAMNPLLACEIIEGICGCENASEDDHILAWQYVIDTGIVWMLPGFYGRTAQGLIDSGVCHRRDD